MGRRRAVSAAARLRPFWVVIAIGLGLAAIGGLCAVFWPGFYPRSFDVTGNRVVSRDEILQHAAIAGNVNMWLQKPSTIAARIEKIPYVAVAHVHRFPPATIAISVRERTPFAVLRSGNHAVLVDRDLRVLQEVRDEPNLPVLQTRAGVGLPDGAFLVEPSVVALRDDYDALTAAHVVPVELSFDSYGGLVATVRGGVRILLGDDSVDLNKKLALVDPILAQVVRKERRVSAVDLRAPSTPVVVYK